MNNEIENLIDLAIADGQITEMERKVILKKAAELGVDQDEVEMTLDGKLHQLIANQIKPTKEKAGNIKVCPACGASLKAQVLECHECGHEFQNQKVNKNIQTLIDKLEKEDNKCYEDDFDRSEKKAKIIAQFAIPQNKEDILEFLSYSYPFLENPMIDIDEKQAWKTKVNQAIMKAKMAGKNSFNQELLKEYELKVQKFMQDEKKSERNSNISMLFFIPLSIFLAYLMFAFIASWFGAKFWPF